MPAHHQSQTSFSSPEVQLPALESSGVLQFTWALQGRQKGSLRSQLDHWLEVQELFVVLDAWLEDMAPPFFCGNHCKIRG